MKKILIIIGIILLIFFLADDTATGAYKEYLTTDKETNRKILNILDRLPSHLLKNDMPKFHFVKKTKYGSNAEWFYSGDIYIKKGATEKTIAHEIGHHITTVTHPIKCDTFISEYGLESYNTNQTYWEEAADSFVLYVYGGKGFKRYSYANDCIRMKYNSLKRLFKGKEYEGHYKWKYSPVFEKRKITSMREAIKILRLMYRGEGEDITALLND